MGVVAPIASFENVARNPPRHSAAVHFATPTRPPNDDARLQPAASLAPFIEHSIVCTATSLEALWKVAQHAQPRPALGPPTRHHRIEIKSHALTRESPLHELSVAAIRSQESRAEGESEARSRLCLHDSCNTSFRQRPKVLPAKRGKDERSKVRPTIAATSSRPRVWWRPAAGVLEIAQSRPSQLSSHGCPPVSALSACLDTATTPSRMTLSFEKSLAVLVT